MIGPEDIQETPKTNYTPILVLGIAALLLLIVGFISYRDYVNAKADEKVKTSDDRIKKLEQQLANLSGGTGPGAATAGNPTAQQRDPLIEEMQRELQLLKEKNAFIEKQAEANKLRTEENSLKVDRVLDSGPATSPDLLTDMANIPPPKVRDDLSIPGYVRDSVATPPGGYRSPAAQRNLTELEKKVKAAPAIGKVVSFNNDWNLVTINAGKSNGVDVGQRYSIRRGSEVLGVVKIFEAFSGESNANIVTNNKEFDGALKPQAGDDIISFEPF